MANLKEIMSDNTPEETHPIGILTSQNRDEWARQRKHLEATGNAEVLKKIDSAIFNLVLDDSVINNDKHKILSHYLHGDGLNRWVI